LNTEAPTFVLAPAPKVGGGACEKVTEMVGKVVIVTVVVTVLAELVVEAAVMVTVLLEGTEAGAEYVVGAPLAV